MNFQLMSITGLEAACASLKFTRRTWTPEWDTNMRSIVQACTGRNGFYIGSNDEEATTAFKNHMYKLAQYGAGYGSAAIDAGHETLLRFIDFEVIVRGLHRGAQDDLDAHAMRMNNRIVRASSRPGNATNTGELSDWYKDKILTFEQVANAIMSADEIAMADYYPEDVNITVSDGENQNTVTFKKSQHGYIREDLIDNGDAQRGLYRLGMASDCIFKVSLHDMRHIYKRRNQFTKASPELAMGIESLANQIEDSLPVLGMLIRYDYCDDGKLHHVMEISKHYDDTRELKSSIADPNAAKF